MKICSKCKVEKYEGEFYKTNGNKFGLEAACKTCNALIKIDYYIKNKDKRKKYAENNRNKILSYQQAYRNQNKDKTKLYNIEYSRSHRKELRAYSKNRLKSNIKHKIAHYLRSRINSALRKKSKPGSAIKDLGCSIDFLKTHLESKWQPGMSWDNWTHNGWHIDHIIPLSSFNLQDPEEFKKACHYTNLQPLWAKDNLSKSDKLPQDVQAQQQSKV